MESVQADSRREIANTATTLSVGAIVLMIVPQILVEEPKSVVVMWTVKVLAGEDTVTGMLVNISDGPSFTDKFCSGILPDHRYKVSLRTGIRTHVENTSIHRFALQPIGVDVVVDAFHIVFVATTAEGEGSIDRRQRKASVRVELLGQDLLLIDNNKPSRTLLHCHLVLEALGFPDELPDLCYVRRNVLDNDNQNRDHPDVL